jgi:hypothetical protein
MRFHQFLAECDRLIAAGSCVGRADARERHRPERKRYQGAARPERDRMQHDAREAAYRMPQSGTEQNQHRQHLDAEKNSGHYRAGTHRQQRDDGGSGDRPESDQGR